MGCRTLSDDTTMFSYPGTTIESGEGMTYFVPITDGYPLNQSTFQLDVAGQDLTLYLMGLLTEKGTLLVSTGKTLLSQSGKLVLGYELFSV